MQGCGEAAADGNAEKKAEGGNPAVSGQYLIGPDGTINLRQFGCVRVSGMTVAEARTAVAKQLKQHLDSPEVAVEVVAYNSKVYYIITQGAGLGDNVRRLPVTGKETVLNAISQINGLSQVSSKNITIVRPNARRQDDQAADRLGRHCPARQDRDQLPDLSRRSRLHRRRPAVDHDERDEQENIARRTPDGHCRPGHQHGEFHRRRASAEEALKTLAQRGYLARTTNSSSK